MSDIDVLRFTAWIKTKDSNDNWVTVAQLREIKVGSMKVRLYTSSVLVSDCNVKEVLSSWDNVADNNLGKPSVWTEHNGKLCYDENSSVVKEGMEVEPFTFFRTWYHKSLCAKHELIQEFILFYNLFWDEKSKTWKAISDKGEEFDVVKITRVQDNDKIEINTKFLRNYLSIKKKTLVRQHDHQAYSKLSLQTMIGKPHDTIDSRSGSHYYRIALAEMPFLPDHKTVSTLFGNDIILPYPKGQDLLGWEKENYCKFIIGVDSEGKDVECTCDKEKIGLQSEGKAHSLTSVFFKREVLKKYYDKPSIFSVSATDLNCSGLWSLPIDTNSKELIHVYLGDLGHMPYEEQQHWRLHNVPPEGGMTPSRWKRDFEAEFADPDDPIFKLTKAFSKFQIQFEESFGFKPFLPLDDSDKQILETLRVPLNKENPEFEQQIGNLAKLLSDSIDIKSLKQKLLEQKIDRKDLEELSGKKIRVLELFFEKNGIDNSLIETLDLIQELRSYAVAHRKGENYQKMIKRHGLDENDNIKIFKEIVKSLIDSFEKIQ